MRGERYRLLVFDWDGTLMDSIGAIVACARATLEQLGLPAVPDATLRSSVGLGLRETVEVLSPGCDETLMQRIVAAYSSQWHATFRDRPEPFSGVGDVLAELGDAGYLLAVATGKSRRGLERDLAASGLGHHFLATRTVDEAFSKPNPKMLFDLLDELGARPAESLMIGDSRWDLEMAANAGISALAVASGSLRREELEPLGPVACLDGVSELPAWLRHVAVATAASG